MPAATRGPEAALFYVSHNVRVLRMQDKQTPRENGFGVDNPDFCSDPADFLPSDLVGILCGPCPALGDDGLLCLDLDGPFTAEDLVARLGSLPETLTSHGGRHLFFRVPPSARREQLRQWRDVFRTKAATGGALDLRWSGGYACEVGDWEGAFDPARIATLPDAALEALLSARAGEATPAAPADSGGPEYLTQHGFDPGQVLAWAEVYLNEEANPCIEGRGGDDQLLVVAGAVLVGYGLDPETSRELLLEVFNPRCEPPWDEGRIDYKLEQVLEHGSTSFWPLQLAHRDRLLEDLATAPPSTPEPSEGDDEPTPGAELKTELIPFPLDTLPEWMRRWSLAVTEELRVPLEAVVGVALGVLASAVQGRWHVQAGPNWREELALWVNVVQPPGASKSPIFRKACAPIYEAEKRDRALFAESVRKDAVVRDLVDQQIKKLKDEQRKRGDGFDPQALDVIANLQGRLERPPVLPPQYYVQGVTPEKLLTLLAQHGRLACVSDEGGDIYTDMAGRYSDKPNLSIWLSGYDGDPGRSDALSRSVDVKRAVLTMVLMCQPVVLQKTMSDEMLRGRGANQRFCWIVPDTMGVRWSPEERPEPVPESVQAEYVTRVMDLFGQRDVPNVTETAAPEEIETELDVSKAIFLSAAAADRVHRLRCSIELRVKEGDLVDSPAAEWLAKHTGRVVRIAGLLHLASGATGDISDVTLAAAERIGECLISHALRAFGGLSAGEQLAADILDFVRAQPGGSASKRDVYHRFKRRCPRVSELDGPIEDLRERGLVTTEQLRPTSGGRPSLMIRVR